MKRKGDTRAAIARLAALFPYGALEADTMPAAFLGHVADEIERLRAKVSGCAALIRVKHEWDEEDPA